MTKRILPFLLCIVSIACSQNEFPNDYKEKTFAHIEKLCSYGIRNGESDAGKKTIEYITKQFKNAALETSIDTFSYNSFTLDSSIVKIGETLIRDPKLLFFDPYKSEQISGNGILCNQTIFGNNTQIDEKSSILLVSENDNPFKYIFKYSNVKASIVINDSIFKELQNKEINVSIKAYGRVEQKESYNIVGVKKGNSLDEIIVSAHWDCIGGPGANDNASGIATVIELSKYFSENNASQTMRFIAFGAEEIGLVGSKAYVQTHYNKLQNCKFIFNIDAVGGEGDIRIETKDGVCGFALQKTDYEAIALMATTDDKMGWINFDSTLLASLNISNVPNWLEEHILEANKSLGYNLKPSRKMGSDHRMFYLAGIPGTNIATSGDYGGHTPADVVSKINKNSLEKVGRLTALSILNAINEK
jgi:hypothetical protein